MSDTQKHVAYSTSVGPPKLVTKTIILDYVLDDANSPFVQTSDGETKNYSLVVNELPDQIATDTILMANVVSSNDGTTGFTATATDSDPGDQHIEVQVSNSTQWSGNQELQVTITFTY